jgi:hypothetical protein
LARPCNGADYQCLQLLFAMGRPDGRCLSGQEWVEGLGILPAPECLFRCTDRTRAGK